MTTEPLAPQRNDTKSKNGVVAEIWVAASKDVPMSSVTEARAEPGRGLEGDRYYEYTGSYSDTPGTGRDMTLIALERLEEIAQNDGITLGAGDTRRNIATTGVDLNALIGVEFKIGEVRVIGMRLCEPCDYLEGLVGQKGTLKALVHKGGLRCDILSRGTIRVGDEFQLP